MMHHLLIWLTLFALGWTPVFGVIPESSKKAEHVGENFDIKNFNFSSLSSSSSSAENIKEDAKLKKNFQLNQRHLDQIANISDHILNKNFAGIDSIGSEWDEYEAPYEIRKNYPYYLSGYDDDGRPIWVIELGKMNLRKLVEENGESLKAFKMYAEQTAFILLKSLKDRSTPEFPVTDAIMLIDMDGLKIFQLAHFPTVQFVLELARKYQYICQRHLYLGILVNSNSVGHTLINIVKPVIGQMFEKIEVYGTNKSKFIPQLLKHCPKDQLAPWYGGNKNFRPVRVYG